VKTSRYAVNTIFVPSGDQAGDSSIEFESVPSVRLTTFEPSAFMTKMSGLPSRLLEKAIFVPSGDQAALEFRSPLAARVFIRDLERSARQTCGWPWG
jgi:hypothetical protein